VSASTLTFWNCSGNGLVGDKSSFSMSGALPPFFLASDEAIASSIYSLRVMQLKERFKLYRRLSVLIAPARSCITPRLFPNISPSGISEVGRGKYESNL